MSANRGMGKSVSREGTEGHCGENTQSTFSTSGTVELPFMDHLRNQDLVTDGYEVLRGACKILGLKQLAFSLGRDADYGDRIGDGLNRRTDRYAHFDWIVPVLRHPVAGPPLLAFFCKVAGYHLPQPRAPLTPQERLTALIKKCESNGEAGAAILKSAAGDLDLDEASFKR